MESGKKNCLSNVPFFIFFLFSVPTAAISNATDICAELFDVSQLQGAMVFGDSFLPPNEVNPSAAKSLFSEIQPGVLLSVGTERVLFDYLLSPVGKIKRVIAMDFEHDVLRFHSLNRILLKLVAKGDMIGYRGFRLNPSLESWVRVAESALAEKRISPAEFHDFANEVSFNWWQEKVVKNSNWALFYSHPSESNSYKEVNYLYINELFNRVQELSFSGRYDIRSVNLSDRNSLISLITEIQHKNETISAIDISNAWQGDAPNVYLGQKNTAVLLATFSEVVNNQTMFLITFGIRPFLPMYYRGYSFEFMRALHDEGGILRQKRTWYEMAAHDFRMEQNLVYFGTSYTNHPQFVFHK